jgi:hypothetical protein
MEYWVRSNVVICLVVRSSQLRGSIVPRAAENLDERTRRGRKSGDVAHRSRSAEMANPRPYPVHPDEESATPSRRTASPAQGLARPRLIVAAGGLIFVVSFVAAMLLIKPARPPTTAMMRLSGSSISDLKTLMGAVKVAGLKGSPDVKGAIEEVARIDNDQIALRGWAVDIGNTQEPLTVMTFVDGHNSLAMEANGRRDAAVNVAGLAASDATNVAFAGRLKCGKGQKLIVVAVAQNDTYGHFGSRTCP